MPRSACPTLQTLPRATVVRWRGRRWQHLEESRFNQTGALLLGKPAPKVGFRSAPQAPNADLVEPFSERELEVLKLLAEGLTNQETASRLFLTLNTVVAHWRNIYGKLGVDSRTRAVARARALGSWVPLIAAMRESGIDDKIEKPDRLVQGGLPLCYPLAPLIDSLSLNRCK